MRMMMRVYIPVEGGNAAIKSGSLAQTFQQFMDAAKPEAAYFVADGGERTTYFFFDLKHLSDIEVVRAFELYARQGGRQLTGTVWRNTWKGGRLGLDCNAACDRAIERAVSSGGMSLTRRTEGPPKRGVPCWRPPAPRKVANSENVIR